MRTYNVFPYYDDYDPSKGYVQILAVAGRRDQSREFTQASTMMRDFVGRLGDAIFKEGAIIDGCVPVVDNGVVKISPGRLYYAGIVRIIEEEVSVPIVGAGSELIGVKLVEEIVTENQDASLRNPAVGTAAAGTEGAHRVKQSLQFTCNDSEATTLFRLEDGIIVSERVYEESTTDIIMDVMAHRTYDENGNFKVEGLTLVDINEYDETAGTISVGLSQGKAYIQGYEVVKPYQTKFSVNYSNETSLVSNEPKIFLNGVMTYRLNNYPMAELIEMTVDRQETIEMTRGTIRDGYDYIPRTPVISIVSIEGYTQGVDYQLSGDRVDWSVPGGAEPASGSTYTITYTYKYNVDVNNEVTIGEAEFNGEKFTTVTFKSVTTTPINNSEMEFTYRYYLYRKDLALLNKNGEITVLEGVPAPALTVETPINQDDSQLVLGSIMVMPHNFVVYIVNQETTRLTQDQIYNLKRRIDDLEVSLAMTDLDREAMDGEDATDLKGIFTDGFIGFTKADIENSEFDCSIDTDLAEMTLPMASYNVTELEVDEGNAETNCHIVGRVVTAPYTETAALRQLKASGPMLINPYAVYKANCPVKLFPEVDNWIDTTVITINKTNVKSYTLRRWWYHRGESWAESEKNAWKALGFNDGGASLGWSQGAKSTTSVTSQVVADDAITYMRQRVVKVTASNFPANLDNIKCYFNDIQVPITSRVSATYKPCGTASYTGVGTIPGTVKACPHGHIWGQFTIPSGQPCGSARVRLVGLDAEGEAVYQASGRQQTVQKTVLTTKIVVNPVDPLAQSFGFIADTVITSVDLYFAAKDSANKPCTVQIRNMVNGYPGTECYAEEILEAEDIVTSSNATAATKVTFTQPVYCNANVQYCVVILTDSNLYQLWVAELGKTDITGGGSTAITSQPYTDGVLFSSSNALTWTAHQTMDLKFALYKATYSGRGSIVFRNVSVSQMNRIVLAAQAIDYKNAGLEWWFRNKSTDSWKSIDTFVARDLDEVTSGFFLKANLNVAYSTSPIIALDCVNLVSFLEGTNATYVSRMIETEETFTNIKVMLQLCLPSSACTAKVYYKLEDVSNTWVELTNPDTSQISNEWVQYQWEKTGLSAKRYRIKIELHTPNPLVRPRARKLISILKY